MNTIIESGLISATTVDLLAGGRLAAAPANGIMLVELLADLATAAANFVATIQLPDNSVPVNNMLVPGANPSIVGSMDDRQKFMFSTPITQGGKLIINVTETGAAVLMYRVTFTVPQRR